MFIGSNLLKKYCFEAEYVSYKTNILIKYRIQIMYYYVYEILLQYLFVTKINLQLVNTKVIILIIIACCFIKNNSLFD